MSEWDREADTESWYEPRVKQMSAFLSNVTKWVDAAENPDPGSQIPAITTDRTSYPDLNTDFPDDSTSVTSSKSSASVTSSKGSQRSTASVRIVAEAESRRRPTSDAMNEYCDTAREKASLLYELSGPQVRPKRGVQFLTLQSGYVAQPYASTSDFDQQPYSEPLYRSFAQDKQSSAYPAQTNGRETRQTSGQGRQARTTPLPNLQQESANLSSILRRQNKCTKTLVKQQVLSTLPQGNLHPLMETSSSTSLSFILLSTQLRENR